MPFDFRKIFIDLRPDIIKRIDWVKYLTLPLYHEKILRKKHPEIFEHATSERFQVFLNTQIQNYLKGEEIAMDIKPAIMNCADMLATGDGITLHAGDYIALQSHFKQLEHTK